MAVGAILGLAGSVFTNVFGWLNRKEDRKELALRLAFEEKRLDHETRKWDHETALLTLQSQAKVSETESEMALAATVGSQQGLIATIQSQDKAMEGTWKWVKSIISLMRPALTTAFTGITVYAALYGLGSSAGITEAEFGTLGGHEALAVIYGLTELSVTWWFGDRSIKRVMNNTREGGTGIRGAAGAF